MSGFTSAHGTKRTLILRSVTSVIGGKADLIIVRTKSENDSIRKSAISKHISLNRP
jgi:hypothetical protein